MKWLQKESERGHWVSLPTRERGLKSVTMVGKQYGKEVAPYAGAWIEIYAEKSGKPLEESRSLRGSVD